MSKAVDDDEMARHLAAANGQFGVAADHLSDAEAHLNRALRQYGPEQDPLLVRSGYSRSASDPTPARSVAGATAVVPTLDDLTEGHVPAFDSVAPYGSKMAASSAYAKMVRGQAPGRHSITKPSLRWR